MTATCLSGVAGDLAVKRVELEKPWERVSSSNIQLMEVVIVLHSGTINGVEVLEIVIKDILDGKFSFLHPSNSYYCQSK